MSKRVISSFSTARSRGDPWNRTARHACRRIDDGFHRCQEDCEFAPPVPRPTSPRRPFDRCDSLALGFLEPFDDLRAMRPAILSRRRHQALGSYRSRKLEQARRLRPANRSRNGLGYSTRSTRGVNCGRFRSLPMPPTTPTSPKIKRPSRAGSWPRLRVSGPPARLGRTVGALRQPRQNLRVKYGADETLHEFVASPTLRACRRTCRGRPSNASRTAGVRRSASVL